MFYELSHNLGVFVSKTNSGAIVGEYDTPKQKSMWMKIPNTMLTNPHTTWFQWRRQQQQQQKKDEEIENLIEMNVSVFGSYFWHFD